MVPEGPGISSRRPAALRVSLDASLASPELLTSTATAAAMTYYGGNYAPTCFQPSLSTCCGTQGQTANCPGAFCWDNLLVGDMVSSCRNTKLVKRAPPLRGSCTLYSVQLHHAAQCVRARKAASAHKCTSPAAPEPEVAPAPSSCKRRSHLLPCIQALQHSLQLCLSSQAPAAPTAQAQAAHPTAGGSALQLRLALPAALQK
jgi:hypothetical protein